MIREARDDSEFQTVISGPGLSVAYFHAAWCGPCKTFGPLVGKAAEAHPEVRFVKADIEACPGAARSCSVRAVPTVVLLRDGTAVDTRSGAMPPSALERWLAGHR